MTQNQKLILLSVEQGCLAASVNTEKITEIPRFPEWMHWELDEGESARKAPPVGKEITGRESPEDLWTNFLFPAVIWQCNRWVLVKSRDIKLGALPVFW